MNTRNVIFLLILLVFFSLLFCFQMGKPSLFEEDEARITEVARETLITGKWINLQHNFEPWFHKPPLYIWMTVLTSLVFGLNEFTARIWAAIFSIGSIISIFFIGKVLYDDAVAGLSSIILGTSLIVTALSRSGFVDSGLMFFTTVSILCFLLSYKNWEHRNLLIVSACAMAFGTLTKGPLGIILPGSSIFLYLIINRDIDFFRRYLKEISLSIAAYILIGSPWWIIETIIHGKIFLMGLLGQYMIGIYSSTFQKHSGPFYFYIFVVLIGMIPWSVFAFNGLFHAFKKHERDKSLLLILWAAVVLIIFSTAQTKVPGYILPIFPPLSIIAALGFLKLFEGEGWKSRLVKNSVFGLNVLLMLFFLVAVHVVKVDVQYVRFVDIGKLSLFVFLILSITSLVLSNFKNVAKLSVLPLALISVVFVISTSEFFLPEFEYYKPSKRMAAEVREFIPKDVGVEYYTFKTWFRSSLAYYLKSKIGVLNNKDELDKVLDSGKPVVIFTNPDKYKKYDNNYSGKLSKVAREFDLAAYSNIKP